MPLKTRLLSIITYLIVHLPYDCKERQEGVHFSVWFGLGVEGEGGWVLIFSFKYFSILYDDIVTFYFLNTQELV